MGNEKLLAPVVWQQFLSVREIDGLNEAYSRFCKYDVLMESVDSSDRLSLWEGFIKEGFLSKIWDKIKSYLGLVKVQPDNKNTKNLVDLVSKEKGVSPEDVTWEDVVLTVKNAKKKKISPATVTLLMTAQAVSPAGGEKDPVKAVVAAAEKAAKDQGVIQKSKGKKEKKLPQPPVGKNPADSSFTGAVSDEELGSLKIGSSADVTDEKEKSLPKAPSFKTPLKAAGELSDKELAVGGKKLYSKKFADDKYVAPLLDPILSGKELSARQTGDVKALARELLRVLTINDSLYEVKRILEQEFDIDKLVASVSGDYAPEQHPLWNKLHSTMKDYLTKSKPAAETLKAIGISPTQFLISFLQTLKDNKKLVEPEDLSKTSPEMKEKLQATLKKVKPSGVKEPKASVESVDGSTDIVLERWHKLAGILT